MNLLVQHKSYMIVISHHSSRNGFCSKVASTNLMGKLIFRSRKEMYFHVMNVEQNCEQMSS